MLMRLLLLLIPVIVVVLAVEQDANGSILTDAICNFRGVDPQGQFIRENGFQGLGVDATRLTCLRNDRIHFVVDADAPIAGPFCRTVREPVRLVMRLQTQADGRFELLQLTRGEETGVQFQHVGQEIGRGFDLILHHGLCSCLLPGTRMIAAAAAGPGHGVRRDGFRG